MPELKEQQKRFAAEYLVDLNATQAAIRAGYSEKTAYAQGFKLLRHPEVSKELQRNFKAREKRTQVTQDRVILELAKVAFADVRGAMNSHGALVAPGDWDDEFAGAVASMEVVTRPGGVKENGEREVEHVAKIRTWNKVEALDKLAKHVGLYDEKSGEDANGPIEVKLIRD